MQGSVSFVESDVLGWLGLDGLAVDLDVVGGRV
jgi:hypothetical protein